MSILQQSETEHLGLVNPNAFVRIDEEEPMPLGVYNIQCNGNFVKNADSEQLSALLDWLNGLTTPGKTFEMVGCKLVKCIDADGKVVYYDFYRDNRFA